MWLDSPGKRGFFEKGCRCIAKRKLMVLKNGWLRLAKGLTSQYSEVVLADKEKLRFPFLSTREKYLTWAIFKIVYHMPNGYFETCMIVDVFIPQDKPCHAAEHDCQFNCWEVNQTKDM